MVESIKKFCVIYLYTYLLVAMLSFIAGMGTTSFFQWCKIFANLLNLPLSQIDWIIKIFGLECPVLVIGAILFGSEICSEHRFVR